MTTLEQQRYLRAILQLCEMTPEGSVTCGDIAKIMQRSGGATTHMVQTLAEDGLLHYIRRKHVRLSDAGLEIAGAALRRQRLVETFLCRVLGLTWDEVETEALLLAECISDSLTERINEYLGAPASDPHGDPIRQSDSPGQISAHIPLTDCAVGQIFIVRRVIDREPTLLRFLAEQAVTIGAVGRIQSQSLAADLTVVTMGQQAPISFSRRVAEEILVDPCDAPQE